MGFIDLFKFNPFCPRAISSQTCANKVYTKEITLSIRQLLAALLSGCRNIKLLVKYKHMLPVVQGDTVPLTRTSITIPPSAETVQIQIHRCSCTGAQNTKNGTHQSVKCKSINLNAPLVKIHLVKQFCTHPACNGLSL